MGMQPNFKTDTAQEMVILPFVATGKEQKVILPNRKFFLSGIHLCFET